MPKTGNTFSRRCRQSCTRLKRSLTAVALIAIWRLAKSRLTLKSKRTTGEITQNITTIKDVTDHLVVGAQDSLTESNQILRAKPLVWL
ncbi:hypothetical protein O9992_17460 [Vibrio lentus]|nr:hypothetical protein [Vibrio lentus]